MIDLLANRFDTFASHYYDNSIGSEYRKEYQKYHIDNDDNILHIGCGIFPLTEITLAQQTNATIVGIDKDKKIIKKAISSIQHYGLDQQIQIVHGEGENYPLKSFSVIIISSCASPKKSILHHIINQMKTGTKIIIREVETSSKPLFDILSKDQNLSFCGSISHHPFPFYSPFGWESQCYMKMK
jgi:precorrin-6B methylase 2